jgi:hypothetical protein
MKDPIESYAIGACLLLNNERKLVLSFINVDPQSSGSNLLARCYNHLGRNEIQDLNKNA